MAKKSNYFSKCHICVDHDETTYIKTFISYESCFLEQSGFLESAAESNRLKRRLLLGKSKDSYPTQCSCVNATFSMVNCALYTGRWISKARSQIEAPSKYTSKEIELEKTTRYFKLDSRYVGLKLFYCHTSAITSDG